MTFQRGQNLGPKRSHIPRVSNLPIRRTGSNSSSGEGDGLKAPGGLVGKVKEEEEFTKYEEEEVESGCDDDDDEEEG